MHRFPPSANDLGKAAHTLPGSISRLQHLGQVSAARRPYAALFLLRESLRFWKGIPCCHSRVRLAGEKHREKCVVCAHEISFPLRFAGSNKSSMYRCRLIDASGGDLCAAFSFGQYEGALENRLRVQREALGRPLRA